MCKRTVIRQQEILLEDEICDKVDRVSLECEKIIEAGEARGRRTKIRQKVFTLGYQHLSLRDQCFIVLIDTYTEGGECIQLLKEMDKGRVVFDPLEQHCLSVLANQFSDSIFDLDKYPAEVVINRDLMREQGAAYQRGREHLLLQEFLPFWDLPKSHQLAVLVAVWEMLRDEDVRAHLALEHFLKTSSDFPTNKRSRGRCCKLRHDRTALSGRKMRFFDFCLWFTSGTDLATIITTMLSTELSMTPARFTRGIDPVSLDPYAAPWVYRRAFTCNLFSLEHYLERYIKDHWLAVTEYSGWKIIPIHRKEMLETEYLQEMVQFHLAPKTCEKEVVWEGRNSDDEERI